MALEPHMYTPHSSHTYLLMLPHTDKPAMYTGWRRQAGCVITGIKVKLEGTGATRGYNQATLVFVASHGNTG